VLWKIISKNLLFNYVIKSMSKKPPAIISNSVSPSAANPAGGGAPGAPGGGTGDGAGCPGCGLPGVTPGICGIPGISQILGIPGIGIIPRTILIQCYKSL
jgi:hypothetical protein